MPIPLIAAGIAAAAKTGIVGKIGGAIGGAIGGGSNSDPTARSTASNVGPIIRLGAPGNPAYAAAAPEPGTFYLAKTDGQIYQSKAAGFYPIMKPWANQRKATYRVTKLGLPGAGGIAEPATTGGLARSGGVGLLVAAVGFVVVWQVLKRVR
jgi:hypothetical protein